MIQETKFKLLIISHIFLYLPNKIFKNKSFIQNKIDDCKFSLQRIISFWILSGAKNLLVL